VSGRYEGRSVRAEVIVTNPEFGTYRIHCDPLVQDGGGAWVLASEERSDYKDLLSKVKKLAGVL
jgi:hypothetical protein